MSENRTTNQVNLRLPPEVRTELDQWIEEINASRRVNKVTRTSVVLSLLAWGLAERPPWAGGDPPTQRPQTRSSDPAPEEAPGLFKKNRATAAMPLPMKGRRR